MIRGLIISSLLGLLALLGVVLYVDLTAETVSIKKADFSCTRSHDEFIPIYVPDNRGGVQIYPNFIKTCDQYTRKGMAP